MPKPIPIPVRRKIYERARGGESTASLAAAFRLPARTIRHLCRRFRERGPDAIRPDYRAPAPLPHAFPAGLREAALAQRRAHPTWGAVLIRVALGQERPGARRPSAGTLRRWFRSAGLAPAPPPRRPRPAVKARATMPHRTWQRDASEHLALADGSEVSWLRVVDVGTGAVLGTTISPPGLLESGRAGGHAGGPAWAVRAVGPAPGAACRQWDALGFAGRPAHRPGVLGGRAGGRRHGQPAPATRGQRRGGAVPGRGPGVGEPWTCRSPVELQRRMDQLDRWQRELYPAVAGMPRPQAYPGRTHSGRVYEPAREAAVWDIRRAWELVAAHLVPRDVSSQGKVSLYNRAYTVGLRWAGRRIWVGFDADEGAWTFQDEQGA